MAETHVHVDHGHDKGTHVKVLEHAHHASGAHFPAAVGGNAQLDNAMRVDLWVPSPLALLEDDLIGQLPLFGR
jgi:hypothetical protein